ncbi:AAA family ATPase [Methylocystis sp. IM4]|uniref:AAA family ATPase n=1 Tax=Methylocystis sp. IM4 TaxID=3136560 RepID=UPI00311A77B0
MQAAGAAGREGDEASGTAFENAEEQERRTLGEAMSLWEKAGLKVRGVGQTYETAKAFEKKTGIKSVGVHGLLGRWKKKQDLLLVNDVLVVNDAAQLSERQKEWMLRATRAAKARLVLVDGEGMVEIEGGAIGLSVEALNKTAFG